MHPEIILHLAAQPIVKVGYSDPRTTYESNVMGTVNILESARMVGGVLSIVNVTTDKVYENLEGCSEFFENDRLDGLDPYSNSKSCSELVTHCYWRSFFADSTVAVSTARAGNVIGGGDFAPFRIIPDCVDAAIKGRQVILRNPCSIRPYQHVLEPLSMYLTIAEMQTKNRSFCGSYNIGPGVEDCISTGDLADLFCKYWGNGMSWREEGDGGPHEAGCLRLNTDLVRKTFGY